MKKIHWGILSTAKIGIKKIIPAMQQGKHCEMAAIASRTLASAQETEKTSRFPNHMVHIVPYQRVNIFGTKGRIEIEIPFNAPPDRPCRILFQCQDKIKEIELEICNQYTIQRDLFSLAVLNNEKVLTPLKDAVANMKVIEAIIQSVDNESWYTPES